ncbi:MAG: hypothetical protein R2781_07420 [Flavobacteriaceae bacterium]
MYSNTTGNYNVAIGRESLRVILMGIITAVGDFTLYGNTTGTYNTAIGSQALRDPILRVHKIPQWELMHFLQNTTEIIMLRMVAVLYN